MSETILARYNSSTLLDSSFSTLSSQVDEGVTRFVEEATDPINLAALTAGGLAYRWGKAASMTRCVGAIHELPLRILSIGVGLGSEVTAFEFANRSLSTIFRANGRSPLQNQSSVTGHQSPNLWSWNGPGGWKQALASDLVTFGLLKGAGWLAREENFIFQQGFQASSMVAGHHAAGLLGADPKSESGLGEQFLHAAAMSLQLSAGMGLVHSLAPDLFSLERTLDLSASSKGLGAGLFSAARSPRAWQVARTPGVGTRDLFEPDLQIHPPLWMSSGKKGGEEPPVSGSGSASSEDEPPWQHRTFKILARRLGVQIREEEKGSRLTLETQKKVRARVMDLISRPAVADLLSPELVDELRSFVVQRWDLEDARIFTPLYRLYKACSSLNLVPAVPEAKVRETATESAAKAKETDSTASPFRGPEPRFLATAPNRPHAPRSAEANEIFPGLGEVSAFTLPGGKPDSNEDAFGIGENGVFIVADGVSGSNQADRASATAVETVLRHIRGPDDLLGLAMMEAHERIEVAGYDGQTVATAVRVLPDGSVEAAIAGDVELWILLSDGSGNYDVVPYATSRRDSNEPPNVVLGGPRVPQLVDHGPPGGSDEIVRKPIPNIGSDGVLRLNEGDGILLMTDGLARYYHMRPSVQMTDLISGQTTAEGIRKTIQADASGRLETLYWRRSIRDGGGIQRVPLKRRFRIPEGKPMAGLFIDGMGMVYDAREAGSLVGYFGEEDNQTALVYLHRPSLQEEPAKPLPTPREDSERVRASIPPAPYEEEEPTPAVYTIFSLEAESREDLIRRYAHHFEPNGFFVQNSRIPAGSDIRFEVKLKSGEAVLAGRGLVAWTRASGGANRKLPPGMFVQILDLETSTRAFFQYILAFTKK